MTQIKAFVKRGVKIVDIDAGGRHSLAISDEDTEKDGKSKAYGWGFNYYLQLGQGIGNSEDALEPVQITIKGKVKNKIKYVSAGYFHSCIITN